MFSQICSIDEDYSKLIHNLLSDILKLRENGKYIHLKSKKL
jgi:hypothetical protein